MHISNSTLCGVELFMLKDNLIGRISEHHPCNYWVESDSVAGFERLIGGSYILNPQILVPGTVLWNYNFRDTRNRRVKTLHQTHRGLINSVRILSFMQQL